MEKLIAQAPDTFTYTGEMGLMPWRERQREKPDILGLASAGFFFLLIGLIWIATPNLAQKVVDFLKDFELEKEIFPNVFLPVPAHHHPVVYKAVVRLCFAFGLFQLFILVLRFVFRETADKIAGTFSGMVFWAGASFIANMLSDRTIGWFAFLGWIIVLIGLSLVIRSLVILSFELLLRKD